MSIGPGPLNIEIVGVVPDVKYSDVKQTVAPMFYTPWRQDTHVRTMSFYVRSPQPAALLRALPAVLKKIDPGVPMAGVKTMPQQSRENVVEDRLSGMVAGSVAVLARGRAAARVYRG